MHSFSCAAVLFDLDGVLVDSTATVARHYTKWAHEVGLDPAKVLAVSHGVRTVEVVRMVAPHLDAEAEMRRIEKRESDDDEGIVGMPGAADLVRALPTGKWCVVTSGTKLLAAARLRIAGVPEPPVFVTADDVKKGKPDPAPYLRGAELLGVDPSECLVIEDAPAGIESARRGGMKVIAISSTFKQDKLISADVIVSKLS